MPQQQRSSHVSSKRKSFRKSAPAQGRKEKCSAAQGEVSGLNAFKWQVQILNP
jgi:hypothetical protein